MTYLIGVVVMLAFGAEPEPGGYLFAHMLKEEYGRLRYSVSRDGLHWTLLNDGKRVLEEYRGHPDICKGHDGRYYLIGNITSNPEITLWVSDDLIAWSRHAEFAPSFDGIPDFTRGEHHNGAPKIYYDAASAVYVITWHTPMDRASKEEPERMWASMRTLCVTSKDLTAFSAPRRLFEFEMATIDVIVRPDGGTYYAIIKDERFPSEEWTTGKTIRVCEADALLGPYGPPSAPITKQFREAPTVIPQPGGQGWFLYCEQYPAISYECFCAPHLNGPWEQVPPADVAAPVRARHGCMIAITAAECDALVAAFPSAAEAVMPSAE